MRKRIPRLALIPIQARQLPRKTIRADARAFTLVELLVVAAIIGVLASLLFPALQNARLAGMTSKCLSNQKQVTSAYLAYLSDNNNMLWFRPAGAPWSGGSGGLFGAQTPGNSGYLCTLLTNYGLARAAWNGWTTITNRYETVWYCPTTAHQSSISGHGCTYFYNNLGQYIHNTSTPVTLAAVSDYLSTQPWLWDYYGNHSHPEKLYGATGDKNVYSYLDGHSECR